MLVVEKIHPRKLGFNPKKGSCVGTIDDEQKLRQILDQYYTHGPILEIGTGFGLAAAVLSDYGFVYSYDYEPRKIRGDNNIHDLLWRQLNVDDMIEFRLRGDSIEESEFGINPPRLVLSNEPLDFDFCDTVIYYGPFIYTMEDVIIDGHFAIMRKSDDLSEEEITYSP